MLGKRSKKVIALSLATVLAVGLMAGCGSSSSSTSADTATVADSETEQETAAVAEEAEEPAAEEVSLIENITGNTVDGDYYFDYLVGSCSNDGGGFDPIGTAQWGNINVVKLVYQRLADINLDSSLHLSMLKSVEQIDDMDYQLELWDCIYDTAGNHITSSDVDFSFQYAINNGRSGSVSKFDHFEIVDDYTLIWVCNEPFTIGEFNSQISNLNIFSEAAYEAAGEAGMLMNPVGTGPYVLSDYVPGSTIKFEANEDYWMRNLPDEVKADISNYDAQNVREIELQVIQDASTRAIALEMGTIDVPDKLDMIDVTSMQDDYSIVDLPQMAPMAALFNCDPQSVCSDSRIRQAICYALDTDAIAAGVSIPSVSCACLLPRNADTPQEWIDEPYFEYDPDKAKELLEEAGYNGEPIHIIYPPTQPRSDMAIMMQSQLEAAGMNVEIEAMDSTLINTAQYDPSAYDIRFIQLGGGDYVANIMKSFTAANAEKNIGDGKNICFVADDELEELIAAENVDNSVENILAVANYIDDKCYAYSIINFDDRTLANPEIEGDSVVVRAGYISLNSAQPKK